MEKSLMKRKMMSKLIKVATVDDISEKKQKVSIDGEEILIIKDSENIYALSNICSHQEKELSSGFLENGAWVCPHHGARFDIKTGEALSMPAVESIKIYKVVIDKRDIFIEMEEE